MKKNRMMRLASILLVCVLLTTSVISGTFAKYTTSDTGTDTARVAKWGFIADDSAIVLDDLFVNVYGETVDGEVDTVDVVAPGTDKSVDFTFEYDTANNGATKPEVDYTFDVELVFSGNYTALDNNPNFVWIFDGTAYKTSADLIAAVEALEINATPVTGKADNYYNAGTLPTAFFTAGSGTAKHTLGWTWLFDINSTTTLKYADNSDVVAVNNDVNDTAMGNDSTLADVTVTLSVTATQVD